MITTPIVIVSNTKTHLKHDPNKIPSSYPCNTIFVLSLDSHLPEWTNPEGSHYQISPCLLRFCRPHSISNHS